MFTIISKKKAKEELALKDEIIKVLKTWDEFRKENEHPIRDNGLVENSYKRASESTKIVLSKLNLSEF